MRHLEHVVEARAKLRAVSEGYLEQAKVDIAALDPVRASKPESVEQETTSRESFGAMLGSPIALGTLSYLDFGQSGGLAERVNQASLKGV